MLQATQNISVIICAYTEKRWNDLVAAIESLRMQTLQPTQIIIVIDHNPQLLKRAQDHMKDVMIIENTEERGLSGARNSGIAVAKSHIIAFLDDDAIAIPEWLMLLNEGFSQQQVMGVGGAVIPLWSEDKPAWLPKEFYWVVGCTYQGMPRTASNIRNLIGANMAFRREIFHLINGFRSDIGRVGTVPLGCEETELCIRVRQKWPESNFLYLPQASVFHQVPTNRSTWRYFCSRCYSEGLSKAVVTHCVGPKGSLTSEYAYILRTLPRGIAKNLSSALLRCDATELAKVAVIVIGLLITIAGYLRGCASLWQSQLRKEFSRKITHQERFSSTGQKCEGDQQMCIKIEGNRDI